MALFCSLSFYSRWCSSRQHSWLLHRAPISTPWRPSQPLRCSKWQLSTSTAWWLPQWRPLQVGGTLSHRFTAYLKGPLGGQCHYTHDYSSTEKRSMGYAMTGNVHWCYGPHKVCALQWVTRETLENVAARRKESQSKGLEGCFLWLHRVRSSTGLCLSHLGA